MQWLVPDVDCINAQYYYSMQYVVYMCNVLIISNGQYLGHNNYYKNVIIFVAYATNMILSDNSFLPQTIMVPGYYRYILNIHRQSRPHVQWYIADIQRGMLILCLICAAMSNAEFHHLQKGDACTHTNKKKWESEETKTRIWNPFRGFACSYI